MADASMADHRENGRQMMDEKISAQDMAGLNELTRQVTVPLSPEVYERLFFQPTAPKGDLAKILGNPTLLGLLGFLIPYQSTMFSLLEWQGADLTSTTALSGAYFFLGGIAMNIAGIFEMILGNSFPAAVFIIYGTHWAQLGFYYDPAINIPAAYATNGGLGALSLPYNGGTGHYNLTMCMVSFILFIGSLRTNIPFALAIFSLIPLFGFLAGANFYLGFHPTPEGLVHAAYLAKIGGGFGFIAAVCGWYLAIITVCASVGLYCPLPIFDLSTRFGAKNKEATYEHARSGKSQNATTDKV